MTRYFDMVYASRAVSAPVDLDRGFFSIESGSLDAPECIPAGSTESNENQLDEHDAYYEPFHVTSFHFRGGF